MECFGGERGIFSARQDADSCVRAFQHFTKPDDRVGNFYSDNSGEIAAAVKSMGWKHVLSQPYVSQSSGVIEREIRTILTGARANLFQSGLPVELGLWLLNIMRLLHMLQFRMTRTSRRGLCVLGLSFLTQRFHLVRSCRIGSIVSASIPSSPSFCLLRMLASLFAIMCSLVLPIHEILVLPLKNLPEKLRNGDTNPIRVKQYEPSLEYRTELEKKVKPAATDVAATAVYVQPNHAVHGQGGPATKLYP